MSWKLWNQDKPVFCKPLVLYLVNCTGTGYFVEGQYDPRECVVTLNGTELYTIEDGTSWIYKDELLWTQMREVNVSEDERRLKKYNRCISMWTRCELQSNRLESLLRHKRELGEDLEPTIWKLNHAIRWKKKWLGLLKKFEKR